MKGAPERILDRCDRIMLHGNEEKMTEEWATKFTGLESNQSFCSKIENCIG